MCGQCEGRGRHRQMIADASLGGVSLNTYCRCDAGKRLFADETYGKMVASSGEDVPITFRYAIYDGDTLPSAQRRDPSQRFLVRYYSNGEYINCQFRPSFEDAWNAAVEALDACTPGIQANDEVAIPIGAGLLTRASA